MLFLFDNYIDDEVFPLKGSWIVIGNVASFYDPTTSITDSENPANPTVFPFLIDEDDSGIC